MSFRVVSDVYDFGPDDPICCAVLVALASHANDKGQTRDNSMGRIALMTRYSERTVSRAVATLEAEGWLAVTRGRGRGVVSWFTISTEKLKRRQADAFSEKQKGDSHDKKATQSRPLQREKGESHDKLDSRNRLGNTNTKTKANTKAQPKRHTTPVQASVEIGKGELASEDAPWRDGWNGVLSELHKALVANRPQAVQDRLGGHDDWEQYFARMACLGVDRRGGTAGRLVLRVPDAAMAQRGMVKYHKRICAAMVKYFGRTVQVMLVDSG